jgi:hypothetical protein
MMDSRRAALSLHSLGENDRDWIISQLPKDKGRALQVLVNELDDLGFPQNAALLSFEEVEPIAVAPEPDDIPLPATEPVVAIEPVEVAEESVAVPELDIAALKEQINSASPKAVLPVLEAERPFTVAMILQQHQWRWMKKVLRKLDKEKCIKVEGLLASKELSAATRVKAEILQLFAEDLGMQGAADGASSAPRWALWRK